MLNHDNTIYKIFIEIWIYCDIYIFFLQNNSLRDTLI